MNIELKNIQVYVRMSEETVAFVASLYVNGERAGEARNDGRGGNTLYYGKNDKENKLIREAEDWCSTLPRIDIGSSVIAHDGKPFTLPMNLERYIDDLLEKHLEKKDLEKFNRRAERDMQMGILVGIPDEVYSIYSFNVPMAKVFDHPQAVEILRKNIAEKILPVLKDDQKILNTNFPPQILKQLEIPEDKIVAQKEKLIEKRKTAAIKQTGTGKRGGQIRK